MVEVRGRETNGVVGFYLLWLVFAGRHDCLFRGNVLSITSDYTPCLLRLSAS